MVLDTVGKSCVRSTAKLFTLLGFIFALCSPMYAFDIPNRTSPPPETTNGVPHIQIGVKAVPELTMKMLDAVDQLPGVEIRDTIISLPGALGFWISEEIELQRPDTVVRGREFAHVHPDGSLHATLNPVIARKAIAGGWAIAHPWSNQRVGWEGFVMIYTPQSEMELEVVLNLIIDGYGYVTGNTVQ